MNNLKKHLLVLFILICILFSSCGNTGEMTEAELDEHTGLTLDCIESWDKGYITKFYYNETDKTYETIEIKNNKIIYEYNSPETGIYYENGYIFTFDKIKNTKKKTEYDITENEFFLRLEEDRQLIESYIAREADNRTGILNKSEKINTLMLEYKNTEIDYFKTGVSSYCDIISCFKKNEIFEIRMEIISGGDYICFILNKNSSMIEQPSDLEHYN